MANEEIGVVLTAGVDVREEAGLPEEGTLVLTSVGGGRWETTVWGDYSLGRPGNERGAQLT